MISGKKEQAKGPYTWWWWWKGLAEEDGKIGKVRTTSAIQTSWYLWSKRGNRLNVICDNIFQILIEHLRSSTSPQQLKYILRAKVVGVNFGLILGKWHPPYFPRGWGGRLTPYNCGGEGKISTDTHVTCVFGLTAFIHDLLSKVFHGCKVNARGSGHSPLIWARTCCLLQCLEFLINFKHF